MFNIIVAPKNECENSQTLTKRVAKYLKAEKVEYSVYFSNSYLDFSNNIKEAISFGETDFIVVGDDLALHNFVNEVKDINRIKFGIISAGKRNDFATSLNIKTNPILAVKDIIEKNVENVDFLIVNGTKVINNILIGASVHVKEIFDNYKIKNSLTERFARNSHGKDFEGVDLFFDVKNSKIRRENVFELIIANAGMNKGKNSSPLSNLKDGLFNVSYSTVDMAQENKHILKTFENGSFIYNDKNKQLWLNNLKLSSPNKEIKAIIDGEMQIVKDLEIEIIEAGLKIYCKN